MKKVLLMVLVVNLSFSFFSGLSQAEDVISEVDVDVADTTGVESKPGLSEAEKVEQNVNDMLKLLEDLENDESFGKELKVTEDEESKTGEANPLDQFIKPEEPATLPQSSQKKKITKNSIEAENELVKLAPDDPDSHFKLGLKYWRSKNHDEAIRHFNEVLRLAPENAHAYWNLGLLYEEKMDYEKATANIKKAEAIYLKYDYSRYAAEAKTRLESISRKNADSAVNTSLSN